MEERVLKIMEDFRHRRLRWMIENHGAVDDDEFPDHISREAEAKEICALLVNG